MNDLVRRLQRIRRQYGKYRLESYADPSELGRRSVADLVQIVSADNPSFTARRPEHLRELCSFLDEACERRRPRRLPDGTTHRELRTQEEVFNADSLASLKGAVLTDLHPRSGVVMVEASGEVVVVPAAVIPRKK